MQRPTDTELLDFLADKNQNIANVQLPRECIYRHLDSLRDAIWDAMRLHHGTAGVLADGKENQHG